MVVIPIVTLICQIYLHLPTVFYLLGYYLFFLIINELIFVLIEFILLTHQTEINIKHHEGVIALWANELDELAEIAKTELRLQHKENIKLIISVKTTLDLKEFLQLLKDCIHFFFPNTFTY